jgi:membrane protein implicated in regulation of membrane protease activity
VQLVPSLVAVAVLVMGSAAPALAYVGPGAGLSLVGAFWGLLVAVFAAFAFVIAWPVRRLLRRRRGAPAETAAGSPLPPDKRPA